MTTRRSDPLHEVLAQIEAIAKRLRAELRRAARRTGLSRRLEQTAAALREQAARLAAQLERYAHELHVELAKTRAAKRPVRRRQRAA
jgi:hypothetical protein